VNVVATPLWGVIRNTERRTWNGAQRRGYRPRNMYQMGSKVDAI